jgi:YD repeat-containing protein
MPLRSGAVSGQYAVEYDNDLRPYVERVNDSNTVTTTFDQDGRPIEVGDMELSYSPMHGRLQTTTLGIVTDSLVYNGFGEISDYLARSGSDTLFRTHYTRDKLGRILSKTEVVLGVTQVLEFAYDSSGRLIQTVMDGTDSIRYAYDSNGNRLMKNHPTLGIDSGSYDGQDRLLGYGGRSYEYNAHGDLTAQVDAGDTTFYSYDVFGNLLSVELPSGTEIEYVVDGHNRRVGRKVNGVLQQGLLYKDALEPVAVWRRGRYIGASWSWHRWRWLYWGGRGRRGRCSDWWGNWWAGLRHFQRLAMVG